MKRANDVRINQLAELREQHAALLAACKTAYADAVHPGSVVALALLEAIRSAEPEFPARDGRVWAAARAGR